MVETGHETVQGLNAQQLDAVKTASDAVRRQAGTQAAHSALWLKAFPTVLQAVRHPHPSWKTQDALNRGVPQVALSKLAEQP